MTRLGAICGTLVIALIAGSWTPLDTQHRVPGWGRVAPPRVHQNDLQLIRPTGGPVVPIFEGWYTNPNGTHQLCFGYFNTNTEEVLEIPIGRDNHVEPEEFDGLQPTHFLPVPPGAEGTTAFSVRLCRRIGRIGISSGRCETPVSTVWGRPILRRDASYSSLTTSRNCYRSPGRTARRG